MKLIIEQINKIFDDIEKMWTSFSKDKPTHRVYKEKDPEQLYKKHTYEVWFPAETQQYSIKIRSRNVRMALLALLQQQKQIEYNGKVYNKDNFIDLMHELEVSGDFGFKQIT